MKKCRQCKVMFEPTMSSLQICCTPDCAFKWAKTIKGSEYVVKAKRAETRQQKQALQTKPQWTKEAQKSFNAYIRQRDWDQPCISCDTPANDKSNYWDSGHYKSVGSAVELRWEPSNAHKQCKHCNRDLSGNIVEFRIRLIKRIGQKMVDWLEGPHEMPKFTIDDIKEIKKKYKNLEKELLEKRQN